MGFNVWTFMCFIIFLCLSPVFGLHQCCHSKYHYSFHYSSFVLFLSVIYYFILNLLYCISLINPYNYLVSFFFYLEMCLLHYCILLFLLNWAWSAARKVHSKIRKQLLLVLALSLVQYSTRVTNMAIVTQHCMLAVWVVVALILVLCLLFAPTMPPVWPPPVITVILYMWWCLQLHLSGVLLCCVLLYYMLMPCLFI